MPHFARNLVLQHVLELSAANGVLPSAVLKAIGLSEQAAFRSGGLVPTGKLIDAVETAARLTRRQDFGIIWGERADYRSFGALGVMVSHHNVLSKALTEVGSYMSQMSFGYSYSLKRELNNAVLNFRIDATSDAPPRHFMEGTILMLTRFGRLLSNHEWNPALIRFAHDHHQASQEVTDAFRCPVEFNQRNNSAISPRAEIDRAIAIDRTPVHEMIRQVVEGSREKGERTTSQKIAQLVPQLLPSGNATIAHVASLLQLSQRTLQRRLSVEDKSFKDIVNHARETIINEQLRLGLANGDRLATALGFSEPSAASRFIRNHLGKTTRELKSQVRIKRG